jgi:hypothetical protein
MGAIYALDLRPMMDSSTKWESRIGASATTKHAKLDSDSPHFARAVSATDYPALEKVSESAVKEKQKFERLVVKKETLLEMFNVRVRFYCLDPTYIAVSTINTRNISSRPRCPTARLPLYTVAVP